MVVTPMAFARASKTHEVSARPVETFGFESTLFSYLMGFQTVLIVEVLFNTLQQRE